MDEIHLTCPDTLPSPGTGKFLTRSHCHQEEDPPGPVCGEDYETSVEDAVRLLDDALRARHTHI